MEDFNKINHKKSLSEFIDCSIKLIYDDEIWKQKELLEVAEVTYTYDQDTGINTRLFCTIGELDLEKYREINSFDIQETLFTQAYTKALNILKRKISEITMTMTKL
jgi:hypothetical protein